MVALRLVPTTSDIIAGAVLLGVGVFLLAAFSGIFELALLVLGGVLALAGLVASILCLARRRPRSSTISALVLGLIGAALMIHEFVPAGDIIHASATVAAFGLGGMRLRKGLKARSKRLST